MMPNFKSILLAGTIAMLLLGAHAWAAPEEAPVAEVVLPGPETEGDVAGEAEGVDSEETAAQAKAKFEREMDEAVALIEKMFDTSDLPPIEPARLTLAQKTMSQPIPSGSLEKMMDNLLRQDVQDADGRVRRPVGPDALDPDRRRKRKDRGARRGNQGRGSPICSTRTARSAKIRSPRS